MIKKLGSKRAFTLIELLLYIGIFAISAGLVTTIMVNSLRIQGNENSATETTNQLNYVLTTVQRLVQQSSEIEYAYQTGASTSTPCTSSTTYCTLELRIQGGGSGDPYDPTCVVASSTGVYIESGGGGAICTAAPVALTNNLVTVNSFQFTIYTIPGGNSTVQVNGSLSYNTTNPELASTKTLESAIGRVSAATFDSSLIPSADNSINLGQGGSPQYRWDNLYLSGNEYLSAGGLLGLGTSTVDASGLTGPGYVYYNTASSVLRVYNGTTWGNLSPFVATGTSAYLTGGNVGIGTSNPTSTLSILGSGTSTALSVTGTSTLVGNVGIDTSTPALPLDVNGSLYSELYNLAYGSSMTVNWSQGNTQKVTLTGNVTSLTFTGGQPGVKCILELVQGGSGSYTVSWPGNVKWSGGTAPTLTTTVGKTDFIGFVYDGSNYYGIGTSLNF